MRSALHGQKRIQIRSSRRGDKVRAHTPRGRLLPPRIEISAPRIFSVIDNPDETIGFICRVRSHLRRQDVRVILRDVEAITPDALLALISSADSVDPAFSLTGDLPLDAQARSIVETCGFDDLVAGLKAGEKSARRGFATTALGDARRGANADAKLAHEIVERVCSMAAVPYHPVSYSNLIECMTNTNNHAGKPGSIRWRVMATCDPAARVVRFVFADPGDGICRTAMRRFVQVGSDAVLLETLLDPKTNGFRKLLAGAPYKTRTGKPGRGRGLRKIAQSFQRGHLRRIVVAANRGYTELGGTTTSKELPKPGFRGTLLYWDFAY